MWHAVTLAVIVIYLLINLALNKVFSGFTATYVVQPVLWIALALLVLRLPAVKSAGKASLKNQLIAAAAMAGVLHVTFLVTAGFLADFGKSPYSFTPSGIMINIIYAGSALLGLELSRAYIVNSLSKKNSTLVIAFVALLFTLLMIPFTKFGQLHAAKDAVTFLGERFLPLLAMNLLATFLAFLGGAQPAMAYRGIVLAFEWFSPVLPDLTPMLTALAGTIAPIVGFSMIQYGLLPYYLRVRPRRVKRRKATATLPAGWIATGVLSVAIIWFSLGLFSFKPVVIYSGSMNPAIDVGDVVMVVNTSPEKILTGDIIEYRTEAGNIVHRVVEIMDSESGRLFVTKGDANAYPDSDPVLGANIAGKVVFKIPKVGWAAVGIKNWLFAPAAEESS